MFSDLGIGPWVKSLGFLNARRARYATHVEGQEKGGGRQEYWEGRMGGELTLQSSLITES